MSKAETKVAPYVKGQSVTVTNRNGTTASGKVVDVSHTVRGDFVLVDLGEAGQKNYRPVNVSPA